MMFEINNSKILDVLLSENNTPTVILGFLQKFTYSEIKNIFKYSLCVYRIFSIDFISKCSENEIEILINYLALIPIVDAIFCIWQCCLSSNTLLASHIKAKFRNVTSTYTSKVPNHYPYTQKTTNPIIINIDNLIAKQLSDGIDFSTCMSLISLENKHTLFSHVSHSLFANRICQFDIFNNLTSTEQVVFLHSIACSSAKDLNLCIHKFLLQILEQSTDNDLKSGIFKIFSKLKFTDCIEYFFDYDFINTYKNYTSFESLLLDTILLNSSLQIFKIILFLILTNKQKLLYDWFIYDRDTIIDNFNLEQYLTSLKYV